MPEKSCGLALEQGQNDRLCDRYTRRYLVSFQFGPVAIPELADRIIAATALCLDLPLLTTDSTIQESSLVKTVW